MIPIRTPDNTEKITEVGIQELKKENLPTKVEQKDSR